MVGEGKEKMWRDGEEKQSREISWNLGEARYDGLAHASNKHQPIIKQSFFP